MVTTTIELPEETHAQLRGIAEREGRRPDQVIRDLIEERVSREFDIHPRPWPTSIGAGGDAGVDSAQLDEWLTENWTDV